MSESSLGLNKKLDPSLQLTNNLEISGPKLPPGYQEEQIMLLKTNFIQPSEKALEEFVKFQEQEIALLELKK